MSKSEKPTSERLAEAQEALAAARAELQRHQAEYARTQSAAAGVAMRGAQKQVEACEREIAPLESQLVAEQDAERNSKLREAKKNIAALAERREALAASVDRQISELTATIREWQEIDDKIHKAWPKRYSELVISLGPSRIQRALREAMARVSAGILSDISPSMADKMSSAESIVRSDNEQLRAAL